MSSSHLEGTVVTDTYIHIMALPHMMTLGYTKEWIEGGIDDQEVVDCFKNEYGEQWGNGFTLSRAQRNNS